LFVHAQHNRARIGRHKLEEKSRIFIINFTRFFQKICRLQNELFDRDINLAIVAGAITVANIEARMRERDFRDQYSNVNAVIGTHLQRGCNALSVAEATRLPRETVRRRINRLIEMGILLRRDRPDRCR